MRASDHSPVEAPPEPLPVPSAEVSATGRSGRIEAAFAAFAAMLREGGFAVPAQGWSAELVAAHVVLNNEEFTRVAEALARGEQPAYDNAPAVDERALHDLVARAGGLPGLADEVERSAARLIAARGALTDEQAARAVHLRIRHDGRIIRDAPGPIGEWIEGNASFHLRQHAEQLAALRGR
ncbi:MAG: hypothetical protein ACJ74O_11925 [Frankiaceae bacterium]